MNPNISSLFSNLSINSDNDNEDPIIFDRNRHLTYLQMMYQLLPRGYETQEINRLTLAYFVISALHFIKSLHCVDKKAIIDWVLSLQAHPENELELGNEQFYGFHGSRSSQYRPADKAVWLPNNSHLASTYSALAILKIIGYDLSLLNSRVLLNSMKNLQQPDGSYMPIHTGAERDLRFVYCAAAICSMLDDWSGMDREHAKEYIFRCQSYDGGFGLIPGSESHGGATYCAVASLRLMGFIEDNMLSKVPTSCVINVPLLLDWTLQRQACDGGFHGRINKPSDSCYAFWVVGVLKILGAEKFIDENALRKFMFTCQSQFGGFSKMPGEFPDLYHSYYGFCTFSLLEEHGMNTLCVELGLAHDG